MKPNSNDHAAHQTVDAAAASAHDAVNWAANKANHATDSLSDRGHDMKETQEKWLGMARDYVQENPATSVGIALLGGYLLNSIFRAR